MNGAANIREIAVGEACNISRPILIKKGAVIPMYNPVRAPVKESHFSD
jgi:hypothetical protein